MSDYNTPKAIFSLPVLLAFMLTVAACGSQTGQTEAPTSTDSPAGNEQTEAPTYMTPPDGAIVVDYEQVSFWFGLDVASSWTVEFIPEGPGSSSSAGPVSHTDPAHLVFSLAGYAAPSPSTAPYLQPRIIIYPLVEMSEQNQEASQRIASLQAWLASPPANPMDTDMGIPFLPLVNGAQGFQSQFKSVGFQNGSGIRYMTMFSQGPMPVSNGGVLYTFQGITDDGAYYVAVTMPVTHPSLAADPGDSFLTDPLGYYAGVAEQLDRQASGSFTPDLASLDAMVESLLVKP